MAQAAHKPTDKLRTEVEAYAAVGVPHHDIVHLVNMSIKTLLKYYGHELAVGKAKANAQVGKTLFRLATNGNVAAAIFWMKAQAGWREKHDIDINGGGPVLMKLVDGRL